MTEAPETMPLRFSGYYRKKTGKPDTFLTQVGPGTPGGEYQRRFWHPVGYVDELGKVPLRVRALGEDLVLFRAGNGEIGCLMMHCCHRNTSLEYGLVEERGLRCCYHGRLFAPDGAMLEIPGDAHAERMMKETSQGAYPVHVYHGMIFIYMGPPDRIPVFPDIDRMTLPGIKIVPRTRYVWPCNWMQIKENSLDPYHTAVLHVIPQMRGAERNFADEFGEPPFITWTETPGGCMYLCARKVDDNIWVRSAETYGANLHIISSIFESGRERKEATVPFMTLWTLPVDDETSINFYFSHVLDNEPMSWEKRDEMELYGQNDERPYAERQWIPGDHDAMVSQGGVNPHELEHLGSQDRGITLFRRYIRRGIHAVQDGGDPEGFYMDQSQIAPTFANDHVAPLSDLGGDPTDDRAMRAYCEKIAQSYFQKPPMARLLEKLKSPV